MLYDAFGRPTREYNLSGQIAGQVHYHALSRDVWDAEDLRPGPHWGTYATTVVDGHGRPTRTVERVHVDGTQTLDQRIVLREYLPTGETTRITQRRAGSPDTVRWMRYDSLGRLVLNVEPNTSTGFTPDPEADTTGIRAWRYAYNDAGDLVGTSDARGCGVNYHFDAAGRISAEDYSPCTSEQQAYTPVVSLGASSVEGAEVVYHYDSTDPDSSTVIDNSGRTFPTLESQYLGRVVSVTDRGLKAIVRYDGRGRITGTAVRVAQPGGATPDDPNTFAARWYIQEKTFDAANRALSGTTGATSPQLMGADGESAVNVSYTRRGLVRSVGSSYGPLVVSSSHAADGRPTGTVFGDVAGSQRAYSYDAQRRLRSVQMFRASPELWTSTGYTPASDLTQQLLLEDLDYSYDDVGNIVEISDWRIPDEWPDGIKPSTKKFDYDDQYRLTRTRNSYHTLVGHDQWNSPYQAENSGASTEAVPSPHVAFQARALEQRYTYDHLGNVTKSADDSEGFFDRSLGTQQHSVHRVVSASNRVTAGARPGDLDAVYDAAGNLSTLIVRRDGTCLPVSASCWQRFEYTWDELGRITRASRWDLVGEERAVSASPSRVPNARLNYVYDGTGRRVLKSADSPSESTSHTVYVFASLELRRTKFTGDYELTSATESVLLAAGATTARVSYIEADLPGAMSGSQRVFLEFADHLGSTAMVIDRATSEVVEAMTHYAYGGSESDYRPERWAHFREAYRFGGKEEDQEVGLAYFGKRYLVTGLGRWASPDPVTIHQLRGDPNPYAYVAGRPVVSVDPNGAEIFTAIAVGAAVGALLLGASAYAAESHAQGTLDFTKWQNKGEAWTNIGIAAGIGAVAGGTLAGLHYAGAFSYLLGPGAGAEYTAGEISVTVAADATPSLLASNLIVGAAATAGGALAGGLFGAFTGGGARNVAKGGEAGGLAGAGASLGYGAGGLVGLAVPFAVVGGLNGAYSGWNGIYDWSNGTGQVAFVSDSSWGAIGTGWGLINAGINFASGAHYSEEHSHRQNRHVYLDGVAVQGNAAYTQGNVVSNLNRDGAGGSPELLTHESSHVWANRLAGSVVYYGVHAVWYASAVVVATGYKIGGGDESWGHAFVSWGYLNNPWELWGYGYNPGGRDHYPGAVDVLLF